MGERLNALEKILQEATEWVAFSETSIWQKLKERIEKEIIEPAKNAFYEEHIDNLTNEVAFRHTISQRATVKTALNVINLVERHKTAKAQAEREIEKIERKKKTSKKETA